MLSGSSARGVAFAARTRCRFSCPIVRRERRSRSSRIAILAWEPTARVRVHNFTISLDGYGAGPRQTREDPLGVGGEALHEWLIPTRAFQRINGKTGGTTGVDDDIAARFGEGIGAWIMGRNMFGPIRGPWPDNAWCGWWGKTPPYHGPVFVFRHSGRPPIH